MCAAKVARLIGGAGTGKTTDQLATMERAIDALGIAPDQVGFASFTRAARREAATRAADKFGCTIEELERKGFFRTIHSTALRCMDMRASGLLTDDKASLKWLTEALQKPVHGTGCVVDFEASDGDAHDPTPADRVLRLWDLARARLEPIDDVWRRAKRCDPGLLPLEYCKEVIKRYETAKYLDDRFDFTDLLAAYAGRKFTLDGIAEVEPVGIVPEIPVWFFDEQQDASALVDLVCHRLISSPVCQFVYVAGDPFQCQPAGTMVETTNGPKPIEQLDPNTDLVLSYDVKGGFMRKSRFLKATRTALVYDIEAGGKKTASTHNHRWPMRWNPIGAEGLCCVYLMRKGDRYRVGWCKLFHDGTDPKNNGGLHLGTRANLEGADAAWILKVTSNRTEASLYESYVAATYGIPTITFRPINGASHLTADAIDRFFGMFPAGELHGRAVGCLALHGRDVDFPFWEARTFKKMGKRTVVWTQLCNLIPGVMMLSHDRKSWHPIEAITLRGEAQVYSLEVEGTHNYFADGFWTGNSIYGWAGASAEHFMRWPAVKERIAPKSWRCGKAILEVAERCLRQCSDYFDRGIAGADHESTLHKAGSIDSLVRQIRPGDEWLLIARSNYAARRWAAACDSVGVPWRPTRGLGGWNTPKKSLGMLAMYSVQRGAPISGMEWHEVLKLIPAKRADGVALLEHGTKTRFSEQTECAKYDWVLPDELAELGATPELVQMLRSGQWQELVPGAHLYCAAVDKWGHEICAKPSVRIGTIHSVKGAEADKVAVLAGVSNTCYRAAKVDAQARDEERRVEYVAVTRARHELHLVSDYKSKHSMEIRL